MNPIQSAWVACAMCKPFQKMTNFELGVGDVVRLMLDRNEPVVPELYKLTYEQIDMKAVL